MNDIPTYEMQPVRRGSFGRRFVGLCIILVLLCAVIACANGPRDGGEEAALWTFAAILIATFAVTISTLKWLFTGRL